MALFGRRREAPSSSRPLAAGAAGYATAASLPEPSTDWTNLANIRTEWESQPAGGG
jgi:hypothetical protein